EYGLSQGEAHILAQLAVAAPATIAELHRGLAHKRSTLTSILDRLVKRGYITREVGQSDRRTFVIETTEAGKRVARRVYGPRRTLEDSASRHVSARDVRAFLAVLAVVEEQAHRSTRAARQRR